MLNSGYPTVCLMQMNVLNEVDFSLTYQTRAVGPGPGSIFVLDLRG